MAKIKVPDGMLKAAWQAVADEKRNRIGIGDDDSIAEIHVARIALEAALRWLAENPVVPSIEDVCEFGSPEMRSMPYLEQWQEAAVRWQRRMFLAPEPEIPEEIRDLLLVDAVTFGLPDGSKFPSSAADRNAAVIEAFHRGEKAAREDMCEDARFGK